MSLEKICLGARCRDEKNVLEWVSYHLGLGFDHIIIYDDISKIPVSDIIYNTFSKKQCTIIRAKKHIDLIGPTFEIILPILAKMKMDFFLDIDLDEYLYLGRYNSVHEFVKELSPVDYIPIQRLNFGDNNVNDNEEGNCIRTFTKCSKTFAQHPKTMIKISKIKSKINAHYYDVFEDAISKTVNGNPYEPPTVEMASQQGPGRNRCSSAGLVPYDKDTMEVCYKELPVCLFHYTIQDKNTFINRKINVNFKVFSDKCQNRAGNLKYENMSDKIRQRLLDILNGKVQAETHSEKKIQKMFFSSKEYNALNNFGIVYKSQCGVTSRGIISESKT